MWCNYIVGKRKKIEHTGKCGLMHCVMDTFRWSSEICFWSESEGGKVSGSQIKVNEPGTNFYNIL